MNRLIGTTLIVILLGVAVGVRAAPANVVMIVSDDHNWADYGFMGNQAVRTPNLDKLAAQGAVFPNGYVPTPLCRPSLASMLTGLYPHQHKICTNDPPAGQKRDVMWGFIKDAPAVPRLLSEKGYRSFQTGKWWESHFETGGFTDGMTVKGRHGDDGLTIGRKGLQPVYDFLEKGKGEPFFLWYAPLLPHTPHNPPARLLAKYTDAKLDANVAKYYAMIEWLDETVGELTAYLEKKGLAQNTLIVYVADNGWVQNLSGTPAKGAQGGPRGKNTSYEGGVRTPILLNWPGRVKPGRYEDLVSSIDLAPTILAACEAKADPRQTGLSLLDVAAGKGKLPRDTVFGEAFLHTSVDVNDPAKNLVSRWVRSGDWKLIAEANGNEAQLFNVAADPTEQNDLAAATPKTVAELRAALDAWWPTKP